VAPTGRAAFAHKSTPGDMVQVKKTGFVFEVIDGEVVPAGNTSVSVCALGPGAPTKSAAHSAMALGAPRRMHRHGVLQSTSARVRFIFRSLRKKIGFLCLGKPRLGAAHKSADWRPGDVPSNPGRLGGQ
jgi:hypothetical protein